MLPPQLRQGTAASRHRCISNNALGSTTTLIRASTARPQARSYWSGHRGWNWTSRIDPIYQRYCHLRTIKTRAKMLQKLRRRGKFEWDVNTKPFFTGSNARYASHWGGGSGRLWYVNNQPAQKPKNGQMKHLEEEAVKQEQPGAYWGKDGRPDASKRSYEFSQREKEWKEQMEALRKRIDQDPYEAVFGKRFEPFWAPLIPNWTRQAHGSEAEQKARVQQIEINEQKLQQERDDRNKPAATANASREELGKLKSDGDLLKERLKIQLPKLNTVPPSTPNQDSKPKAYAYASSTSWNSKSNKTRTTAWNSDSNQTKTFEYDPISNRMVEIVAPSQEVQRRVAIDSDSSAVRQSMKTDQKAAAKTASNSAEEPKIDMPVKQSNNERKAIPIPPPSAQPSHSVTLGYTQTSVGPLRSTAIASTSVKPAALAKLPAKDLDMLTADQVRASMGKLKHAALAAKGTTPEQRVELERIFDAKSEAQDAEINAILKEREVVKASVTGGSSWDQAEMTDMLEREMGNLQRKKEKLLRDEQGLFHIERQKRELLKLDARMKDVTQRVDAMNRTLASVDTQPTSKPSVSEKVQEMQTSLQSTLQRIASKKQGTPQARAHVGPLQTAVDRQTQSTASAISQLQPSLERMQPKSLPQVAADLDDAAAHESTEPLPSATSVPKAWNKQAELLQSDRIRRTAAKQPYPKTRWIDDMNARRTAYEIRQAEIKTVEEAKHAERNAKLEKQNSMLEAEVAEQKFRMQAFEGRYAHKVKTLRTELDRTFKQSSVQGETHVERIRELEAQVAGSREKEARYAGKVKTLRSELDRTFMQSSVLGDKHLERIKDLEVQVESFREKEGRYAEKVKTLRSELDRTFMQSSVQGEKHVERIKELEAALEKTNASAARKEAEAKPYPAEGDLCTNVPRFAGSSKWYKKPSWTIQPTERDIETARQKEVTAKREAEKAEHIAQDQALVKEVREIYESEFGVIDENHRQPEPEVEPSGEPSSAEWEAVQETSAAWFEIDPNQSIGSYRRNIKLRMAAVRKAEQAEKRARRQARKVVEVESEVDLGEELAKYERENPQANRASSESPLDSLEGVEAAKSATQAVDVRWASPPLYKVLAYDSGNDRMSEPVETTSSILPGSAPELPIGIPEALGQLYQPARFVPYFAKLQIEGFQVIAATRDFLVFRKVEDAASLVEESEELPIASVGLEDHGLAKGPTLTKPAKAQEDRSMKVNPIDGTSRTHQEPATGNFASPTGFVNHDPVFPAEQSSEAATSAQEEAQPDSRSDTYSTVAKESFNSNSRQTWASLPGSGETPVKRTETVFSGRSNAKDRKRKLRAERAEKALVQTNQGGRKDDSQNSRSDREGADVRLPKKLLSIPVVFLFAIIYAAGMDQKNSGDAKRKDEQTKKEREALWEAKMRQWAAEREKARLELELRAIRER